ncbi:uncharacterized protein I303_103558 [Kwoniella dejecticola CBS 10117]|uniref:Uncharacterized protein n=1 Tax=Kwoniella dejecticola CBS 10117 TaxID=1296121 RepID=A0A1A6A733_9TREE|nr:uncharacterized protein I303_03580 [Kwoniella dejecticola CBS 10117]OBR85866.1 hypothetical protein I303_03580 [Kwoniella dejecticola CBS 10117]
MPSIATSALIALLPLARAHMSMWAESMYGFSQSYEPVTPLSGKSFNEWWFHGNANDKPSAVTTLVPGQDLTLEMACQKGYTSFGSGNPTDDACPGDSGAYHAGGQTGSQSGWSGNSESSLMGCALAIAFKPTAAQTNMEDFTVMSIQESCVRQRLTSFSIPNNLPACPEGGCTCAWFWAGKNSANEMYMTGFRCDVSGGSGTTYPSPAPPRKGKISGATQPYYWANEPTNLDFTPTWETKPSYDSAWGWTPGAQTAAFGAAGSGSGSGSTNSSSGSGSGSGYGSGSGSTGGYGSGAASTAESGSGAGSGYGSSTATSSAGGNGGYGEPSPTSYTSSPSTSKSYGGGSDGENTGGDYAPSSSRTRGRRPRPTATQTSYNNEETSYGGNDGSYSGEEEEDGEDTPPWQELAADSEGVEGSGSDSGEQALVEQKPKNCKRKRHYRRSRVRRAHSP